MIGTVFSGRRGIPLRVAQAQVPAPAVFTSVDAAHLANIATMQGAERPPAAQADTTTGMVAPPIPGGLAYEKVLLVTGSAPVPLTADQVRRERQL